jgi:spore coat-associated protein N
LNKVLIALMTVVVVIGLVGGGAFAWFSDVETSTDNTFTAGTLDLLVDQNPAGTQNFVDDPDFSATVAIAASNMVPNDSQTFNIQVKNNGTIAGIPTMYLVDIVNYENVLIEPEEGIDTTGGSEQGELGANVDVLVKYAGTQRYFGKLNDFINSAATIAKGDSLANGAVGQWDLTVSIDDGVGNVIQSDKVSFKVVFGLYQDATEAAAGTTPY